MRRIRRGRRRSRRVRDDAFMGWVKTLRCCAADAACLAAELGEISYADAACSPGFVEADHAGPRGLGQKADDDTCIPLCAKHHRERTDFSGAFRSWDQRRMREWIEDMVARTRELWASRGSIPF